MSGRYINISYTILVRTSKVFGVFIGENTTRHVEKIKIMTVKSIIKRFSPYPFC